MTGKKNPASANDIIALDEAISVVGAGAEGCRHTPSTNRDDLVVTLAQAREEVRRTRREKRNLRSENQFRREGAANRPG